MVENCEDFCDFAPINQCMDDTPEAIRLKEFGQLNKALYQTDPDHRRKTITAAAKWHKEKMKDPAYRKQKSKKAVAYQKRKYREDPIYRAKYLKYRRDRDRRIREAKNSL